MPVTDVDVEKAFPKSYFMAGFGVSLRRNRQITEKEVGMKSQERIRNRRITILDEARNTLHLRDTYVPGHEKS